MSTARPLIGLSGRRNAGSLLGMPSGWQDAPLEIYFSDYATSVLLAGGLPVFLPMDAPPAELVERMDAILLVGGDDVDPRRYGQAIGEHTTTVDPQRDEFETALAEVAIDTQTPLLGICRGIQLLNVVRGGSLIQHLPTGQGESHAGYAYPRSHRVHEVRTAPGSLVESLYGESLMVNTFHHQAVDVPGEGLTVTATAPDGVIEAVELEDAPVLAVQWHPEHFGGDPAFEWLVEQARG